MDEYKRHLRVWKILYPLVHPWLCRKFNLTHEDLHVEGPVLLIPNHVCAWDPLLVAMSLKEGGATEDMIEGIADGTIILDGGYKVLTRDEVVDILKASL